MGRNYWLLKSDPETFSIADLAASPGRTTAWDGVRNYQARNYLRDGLKKGDGILFYHSQADPPHVAGLATVVREGYPEAREPRWFAVDLKLERIFGRPIPLADLRRRPELKGMVLLKKGSRLSVQPVTEGEWNTILGMAGG